MIKILFFIEHLGGGGAEKVLCDLVNHMDQTEFDITVHTVWPYDAEKYLAQGICYKSLYPANTAFYHKLYRAEAASGLAYKLHIKGNYDIECAFLESGATKIIAASTNKNAKKLAWVHCDLSRAVSNYSAFEAKTATWYRNYDHVVCVSETVKKSFDHIFHHSFRSDVLYNIIDDEAIRRKAAETISNIAKRKLTMLAVGTMYPPKNYPRLLKAHRQLLQEGIDHDLWILGDGEQREEIVEFIKTNELEDSVKIFGFQKNPYPYMKAADLIVCSSNYEGFSTVVTESTILGKAIVTTDCSGMKEILGESEYGLITENSDIAFCDGVRTMLTNEKLRNHYSQLAQQRGQLFSLRELVSNAQVFLRRVAEE